MREEDGQKKSRTVDSHQSRTLRLVKLPSKSSGVFNKIRQAPWGGSRNMRGRCGG
jgi:hypothetical protein